MAKKENNATYILDSKKGLPNKLLQADGTATDMLGNVIVNPDEAWDSKPALPNKWLNPDGTYSTLNEIIASMVDTSIYVIVDELPQEGNPQKIYLVPDGKGGFVEYHWTGDKWDPVGMIEFDLSNYSTTQEMMNAIEAACLETLNASKSYSNTNFLKKDNTTAYTPSADYNPATKKYVDDNIQVYQWDGSSSSTTASNLTLWQEIYNKAKTKTVMVAYIGSRNRTAVTMLGPHLFDSFAGETTIKLWWIPPHTMGGVAGVNGVSNTTQSAVSKLYRDLQTDTITTVDSIQFNDTDYVYTFLPTNISSQQNPIDFTPTQDMHPATKKYVDDAISNNITSALGGEY